MQRRIPSFTFRALSLTAIGLVIALLNGVGAHSKQDSDLAADMKLLNELLEGEFDNYLQVWEEKETNYEFPHQRIHSVFARVNLPAFGDSVYYVKQYVDGDPTQVVRQRLYSFHPNAAENAIEVVIYSFPEDGPYLDAHLRPSKLEGLTPQSLKTIPGCEVYWVREGDGFKGYMKERTCRIQSERFGKTIIFSGTLKLNREEIWLGDRAVDEEGNVVFGHKEGIHSKLKRCRFFTGWAAVKREGTEEYDSTKDITIHDQGGSAFLTSGDKEYEIRLSQLVYQGSKIPVLTLAVYEKGNETSLAYSWTNPEAKRIGINVRWFQTGMTLKEGGRK